MTIHLPPDIENSIQAAVYSGHFASVDAAMTEAASLLLERLKQLRTQAKRRQRHSLRRFDRHRTGPLIQFRSFMMRILLTYERFHVRQRAAPAGAAAPTAWTIHRVR